MKTQMIFYLIVVCAGCFNVLSPSIASSKLIAISPEPESSFLYAVGSEEIGPGNRVVYKLSLDSGHYEKMGVLKLHRDDYLWEDPAGDRLFLSGRVLDLKTFTIQPFPAGIDARIVSPDGKLIYGTYLVSSDPYQEGTAVIDGKTYKLITTTTEFISRRAWFSPDVVFLYAPQRLSKTSETLVVVDIKTHRVKERIPNEKLGAGEVKWDVWDCQNNQALFREWKDKIEGYPQFHFTYDLLQKTPTSKKIAVPPGVGFLTPDRRTMVFDEVEPGLAFLNKAGRIHVYDLATGTESVTFTLTTLPERDYYGNKYHAGAIIKFLPDSSGFIYNTTEELITFSIPEKKIVKRVPIQYPPDLVR